VLAMSENFIIIIPEDPFYIPSQNSQLKAETYLSKIAPNSEEVVSTTNEKIQFFNAGANFENVYCPFCQSIIEIGWWQNKMDEDYYGESFQLKEYQLPCCNQKSNLHLLKYSFVQGFGKYSLEAKNPNLGELSLSQIDQVERLLESKVRIVYQHL
jgi:hypothetical protein